jgi:hypothetical protein
VGYQERDRQRNRGLFSAMVRSVSHPCEGSKILIYLFRPRLVCNSLLHLRSSWKVNCANFRFTEFSEVHLCCHGNKGDRGVADEDLNNLTEAWS